MNPKELHTLGIDIGSTTVKIAILDEENDVLFSDYERHYAALDCRRHCQICLDAPSTNLAPSMFLR